MVKNELLLLVVEFTLLSLGQALNPVTATHMYLKRISVECDYWSLEVFQDTKPFIFFLSPFYFFKEK